jgi:hypothetical protein
MTLARVLSLINTYALWLYVAGFLALFLAFYELREARKGSSETIFSLERELASGREKRARTVFFAVVGLLALLTLLKYGIVPSQPVPNTPEPTRTRLIIEPPTELPVTPTPTRTRVPTRPRPTAAPPTLTPTPTAIPAPSCSNVGICISSPAADATVTGQASIQGTANTEGFQFYKMEYGIGESPQEWHSIGDIRRTAVVNGTLVEWNTVGFPNSPVRLRLTVVDITGNFPPPYEVRVTVRN